MRAITSLSVLLTLLLLAISASAQTWELRGSLRGWTRGYIEEPNDIDLAQTQLRLELLSTWNENAAFFSRLYITHEGRDTTSNEADRLQIRLQEAYIDWYASFFRMRMGRQIMVWGKADELNPTDVLNPQDLSNFLEDKIIRKRGVFAVKSNIDLFNYDLELIWKPEYRAFTFPKAGSRWGFFQLPGMTEFPSPQQHDPTIQNTEWAAKLSKTFGMFDFAINGFDGWDAIATPVLKFDLVTDGMVLDHTTIYRTRMVGGSFAGSLYSLGLWGEAAYFSTEDGEGNDPFIKNPYFQYVVGSDYTFRNNIKINIQYVGEVITKIDDDFERDAEEEIFSKLGVGLPLQSAISTRIGYPFGFGETNEIEVFAIIDLKNPGAMIGPKLTISPTGGFEIEVGMVIIEGDDESLFGRMDQNDNIFVKAIYSF